MIVESNDRCRRYDHGRISSLRQELREDILRFATFSPFYRPKMTLRTRLSIFLQPSIICIFCYRISHYLYVRRWRRLARSVSAFNMIVNKANIPPQSCIGPGFFLGHCAATTFVGTAGRNLTIFSLAICSPKADSLDLLPAGFPQLGDDVTLGAHSIVIGQVVAGNNVKIAPYTVLDTDCPDDRLAVSAKLRLRKRQVIGRS